MKVSVTFKTPDAVHDAIVASGVDCRFCQGLGFVDNRLACDEKNELDCSKCGGTGEQFISEDSDTYQRVVQALEKFVRHGELITVTFDLNEDTAIVEKV